MATKYVCDRCDTTTQNKTPWMALDVKKGGRTVRTVDLCPNCSNRVMATLDELRDPEKQKLSDREVAVLQEIWHQAANVNQDEWPVDRA